MIGRDVLTTRERDIIARSDLPKKRHYCKECPRLLEKIKYFRCKLFDYRRNNYKKKLMKKSSDEKGEIIFVLILKFNTRLPDSYS